MRELKPRKKSIVEIGIYVSVGAYTVAVISVWLLIRFQGDHWWLATLFAYGPRWIYPIPLALLVPVAYFVQPRLLLPLGFSGMIAVGSLMGFSVPWRTWGSSEQAVLRVLSYNIERYSVPGDQFSALLDRERPDLIAVQECAGRGRWTDWWERHHQWHTVHRGELMIASRFPIKQVEVSVSRWPRNRRPKINAIYCVLTTPHGDVGFCNLHLDTPRRALNTVLGSKKIINLDNSDRADDRLASRRQESADLLQWLSQFPDPKIIAGDFNLAPDSPVFRNHWNHFHDSFEHAGWGFGFTKRTIIHGHEYGLRIDRVLTDGNWTPTRSWVAPDLGSDHLPLFADVADSNERQDVGVTPPSADHSSSATRLRPVLTQRVKTRSHTGKINVDAS